jgi:hypothetical protein
MMKQIYFLFFILLLIGCDPDNDYEFDYDIIISETAINLGELNSEFDDYNSDLPFPAQRMEIYFSSNRNSNGVEFDIVAGKLDFSYHSEDDILNVSIPNDVPPNESELLFPKINSDNNEFGPYTYYSEGDLLFFYATNPQDTFEIKFVELTNWYSSNQVVSYPNSLSQINTIGDNLYPSIDSSRRKLYFCSNREDSCFSIYSAVYNSEISNQSLINSDIQLISKESSISSDFDDKCPYVKDNFMVFTSNRDGSYDLWYSKLENDNWTEPMKFDNNINSDDNEYRPVTFEMLGFNLMIFSSDRPNGKGGYDLYIVKIDKYIK